MNEHDVIARLSAMPDEDVNVHVDVDTVMTSVKVQRKRRRAGAATVLATAALVAGLVVATGQLDRDTATPAAQPGVWTVQRMDIKDATLTAVAPISQSDVWALGYQRRPNATGLAMHWDGTRWKQFDVPQSAGLLDVAAVASDNVWAVGGIDTRDGGSTTGRKPVAAHWDGKSWQDSPIPARGQQSGLSAVAAISADDVWAIGNADDKTGRPFIVHWDGSAWQDVTTPAVPGADGVLLRDIAVVAADDIWVVGASHAGTGRQPLFLHWDGHQWSVIPVAEPTADLLTVAALGPDDVWAATYDRLFHWDGNRWASDPAPSKLNAQYLDLEPDGTGGLLATGRMADCHDGTCDKPDRDMGPLVARWNGTEWAVIQPPADRGVQIHRLGATPGTGVIWATGEVVRPSSGVDVTGKPITEETVPIVASIFFAP